MSVEELVAVVKDGGIAAALLIAVWMGVRAWRWNLQETTKVNREQQKAFIAALADQGARHRVALESVLQSQDRQLDQILKTHDRGIAELVAALHRIEHKLDSAMFAARPRGQGDGA